MIAEDATARELLLEMHPLTPQVIGTLLAIFYPIICLQLLTILPFIYRWLQMILPQEKKLEEDRQAEAILKGFAKGTPLPLLQDSSANQLAMKNMMSPGCRVTRALVVKGTKKRLLYQSRTSMTVYEAPCAEYPVVPSTSLPDSPDRLYWFKPGVLGEVGIPVCIKAWLGRVFI
jgi:hypothetical protein